MSERFYRPQEPRRALKNWASFLLMLIVLLGSVMPVVAAEDADTLVAAGRRLYRDGIDGSGRKVTATSASGGRIPAPQSHCVTCHRPSGFGASEGGIYVPPITGPLLFAPRQLDRNRLFSGMFHQVQPPSYNNRLRQPHMRPAYTVDSLGRLLREGQDAAGVPLIPAMPRYDLSDADIAALAAYLATLSAAPDPGVDEQTMHFATIVTDAAPAAERKVMMETIEAFFDWTNRHTEGDRSRPSFSPLYRSDFVSSYRTWKLHVWTLQGAEDSWPAQLKEYYESRPVFAVISGLVSGQWDGIGRFCDANRLPCLFPLTDLPNEPTVPAGYSIHYSEGLRLEARAMAAFLVAENASDHVIQIAAPGPKGRVPAELFDREIKRRSSHARTRTVELTEGERWSGAVADVSAGMRTDQVLVIWPGDNADEAVAAIQQHQPKARMILFASQALPRAKIVLGGDVVGRVRLIHPTALAEDYNPHAFRARGWMHARGIAADPPDLQYNVYWALTLLASSVEQLLQDYYRDYLVERIEHNAEANVNPGSYPTLSLGPGQRFASRGVFVVRLDADAPDGVRAVSDWIVP